MSYHLPQSLCDMKHTRFCNLVYMKRYPPHIQRTSKLHSIVTQISPYMVIEYISTHVTEGFADLMMFIWSLQWSFSSIFNCRSIISLSCFMFLINYHFLGLNQFNWRSLVLHYWSYLGTSDLFCLKWIKIKVYFFLFILGQWHPQQIL